MMQVFLRVLWQIFDITLTLQPKSKKNGKIKLEASRDIFDMEIDVVGLDKDAKDIGIYFMDRFGYKTLKVEQIKANK